MLIFYKKHNILCVRQIGCCLRKFVNYYKLYYISSNSIGMLYNKLYIVKLSLKKQY